ncbi:Surfeit locus protein 1 [Striga hermonthica]|uniref:SURF1-like protein n=1 Tax=Striga hermonthica TaxID=68872 RepID=A0A9N7MLF0_STRHE|nr:Surfeit locus protein 1 [Striga hermonthica]
MAAEFIFRTLRWRLKLPIPPKWAPPSSRFSNSTPAISDLPRKEQEQGGRSTWSKLLLFIPGAVSFGLGTWQIIRRQEKINMLEYRKSRLEMEPIKSDLVVSSSGRVDSMDFRRVQCRGVFDEKKSIYVGPRSRSISGVTENGYYIITPLVPVPGDPESMKSPILVNRGWVPRSWRDKALEPPSQDIPPPSSPLPSTPESPKSSWWRFWSNKPESPKEPLLPPPIVPTEVIGVVRGNENPNIFVPPNDPNSFQWFYVDVPALARVCGLPENTLYIEDINENVSPSSPYPIPKDVNTLIQFPVMPQAHVNYILTWYSLSAAVTFMAYKRLKPRKIRREFFQAY